MFSFSFLKKTSNLIYRKTTWEYLQEQWENQLLQRARSLQWLEEGSMSFSGELARHLQMHFFEGVGIRVCVSISASILHQDHLCEHLAHVKRQRLHFPTQDPSPVSANSPWKGDSIFISNTISPVKAWGCSILWLYLSLHMAFISLCHCHSFTRISRDHI